MSNTIPEGWLLQPLSALANYHNGRAFKPDDWSHEGLPIVRIAQINNRNADLDYYAGSDVSEKNKIRNGDLLFSWSATLTALIWDRGDAVLNQHIFKVEEKTGVNRSFLHQLILNSIEPLAEHSHGSTMKHIKKSVLDEYCVETPPLPEQKKIAAILSSVDEVIEKTRAQIDKLKDLKTGMMQELLTKGIGHTEFKDSPVGRIPASWKVTDLASIVVPKGLQTGPFGSQLHAHEYVEWGVPVVMPKDMKGSRIDSRTIAYIPLGRAEQLSKHRVKYGDVLFARRGDIGRFALVERANEGWLCGTGCLKARFAPSIDPIFISCYLMQPPVVEWLNANAVGQTMLNLNTSILADLPIILPPENEQKTIGGAISSLDSQVNSMTRKLAGLIKTKKALMQDLLTGKVRVKVDQKEPAVA